MIGKDNLIPINGPDNPIITVSGIIKFSDRDDSPILLIKHEKTHTWNFPGGKVDKDESLEDAIDRELYEELGIIVEKKNIWYNDGILVSMEYPYGSGNLVYFKDYSFCIYSYKGLIENKEPNKHSDLLWVNIDINPCIFDYPLNNIVSNYITKRKSYNI